MGWFVALGKHEFCNMTRAAWPWQFPDLGPGPTCALQAHEELIALILVCSELLPVGFGGLVPVQNRSLACGGICYGMLWYSSMCHGSKLSHKPGKPKATANRWRIVGHQSGSLAKCQQAVEIIISIAERWGPYVNVNMEKTGMFTPSCCIHQPWLTKLEPIAKHPPQSSTWNLTAPA